VRPQSDSVSDLTREFIRFADGCIDVVTELCASMGEATLRGTAELPSMSRWVCTAQSKPLLNDGQRRNQAEMVDATVKPFRATPHFLQVGGIRECHGNDHGR
jgi:hypothetical protein